MTNSIDRYHIGISTGELFESSDTKGAWVLYEDHERIVAELKQEILNQALTIDEYEQGQKGMC